MLNFVVKIVGTLSIGSTGSRVGVVCLSDVTRNSILLNSYSDKASLTNAILNLPYMNGNGVNIGSALQVSHHRQSFLILHLNIFNFHTRTSSQSSSPVIPYSTFKYIQVNNTQPIAAHRMLAYIYNIQLNNLFKYGHWTIARYLTLTRLDIHFD